MRNTNIKYLSEVLADNSFKTVLKEAKSIFLNYYTKAGFNNVIKIYKGIKNLFEGKFPGYQACNTEYHNLDHTMATFLTTIRLLDGYNINKNVIPEPVAVNLLIATFFHDTGYIQEEGDIEGTGAKYTSNHVERSMDFLKNHHQKFRISPEDTEMITRIIQCTGLNADISTITFSSIDEKTAGVILGTADLLGQMADRTYLEKLLFLYYEFREAEIPGYHTEFDILRKTVDFYEITKKKFTTDFMGVYIFDRYHFQKRYNIDRNLYLEAIDRHIAYLHKIIADSSTNFRHKLKRGNWREKIKNLFHGPKQPAVN
ncbi:MAG: hypothetical protein JW969_18625 [Spirochaetales bacterium]|nr:hypothetical protein [Spirochaetales bacterium]